MKKSLITFVTGTIVFFVLRVYQLACEVNESIPQTFFYSRSGIINAAVIILTCLLVYIFMRTDKRELVIASTVSSPVLGSGSAVLALFLALACADNTEYIKSLWGEDSSLRSISMVGTIELLTGVLAVMFFLLLAAFMFQGKPISSATRVLSAFFPLWAAARLIRFYMELTSINNVTENLYTILVICAVALFAISTIRVITGAVTTHSVRMFKAYAYIMIFMFVGCIIPKYILYMASGGSYFIRETHVTNILDCMIAVFAILLLLYVKKMVQKQGTQNENEIVYINAGDTSEDDITKIDGESDLRSSNGMENSETEG